MNAMLLEKNMATVVRIGLVAFVYGAGAAFNLEGNAVLLGVLAMTHLMIAVGVMAWGYSLKAEQGAETSVRPDLVLMLGQIAGPMMLVALVAPTSIGAVAFLWGAPCVWLGLFEARFKG